MLKRKIHLNVREALFVLALATKPLYLKRSGTLQISDLIYMLLFGSFVLNGKLKVPGNKEKKWIAAFAVLVTYQFLINTAWYVSLSFHGDSDIGLIRTSLFYLFNFLVCLTIMQMLKYVGYARLLKLYMIGSVFSVVICYLGVVLNYSGTGRVRGFFNNPNQLGYFSIIVMTVFVVYCREIKKKYRFLIIFFCLILNLLSLSKASIIGSAFLLIFYALISSDNRSKNGTIAIILLTIAITVFIYLLMFSTSNLFSNNYYIRTMRYRLIRMNYESDSDLGSGRGYDRIKEIGLWIVTGVGEGAFTRFSAISGKEIHSMYASILVSYGFIGFIGYGILFMQSMCSNKKGLFSLFSFSGILLYCVTHNGVRNTLLWSLIAMLLLRPYGESKKLL